MTTNEQNDGAREYLKELLRGRDAKVVREHLRNRPAGDELAAAALRLLDESR